MDYKRQALVAVSLLISLIVSTPSYASSILIYGNRATDNNPLQQTFEGLGHTITNVSNNILPSDLSVFDTIWHVTSNAGGLGAPERAALASFVNNGGGLHLTGERPCCETLNDAVEILLNNLIVGPQVTVGNQGDQAGTFTFNSGAVGNIATAPNSLTSWGPSGPGAMDSLDNLAAENVLVTSSLGAVVGAAFDSDDLVGGAGRVTVLMDVNWFNAGNGTDVSENIQVFLESASDVIAMPEPGTGVLLASAGFLVLAYRRRKSA